MLSTNCSTSTLRLVSNVKHYDNDYDYDHDNDDDDDDVNGDDDDTMSFAWST